MEKKRVRIEKKKKVDLLSKRGIGNSKYVPLFFLMSTIG